MLSVVAIASLIVFQTGAISQSPPAPAPAQGEAYVPQRVFDTSRRAFTDFESMLAELARADVVLVGEQHDDANTHRVEMAILQGLARRHVAVTVSLEMFERDVQPALDAYLAGSMSEKDFLEASRPWPRYGSDYRPLVEMAKEHRWPIVAANVPRRYAAAVAKEGVSALSELNVGDRAMIANDQQCPHDAYYERFAETMSGHSTSNAAADAQAVTDRYYQSQCLKDETMAESVAAALDRQSGRPGTIVHFTGAFHSEFGTGTTERIRRRLPARRVVTISILPVADLDGLSPTDDDLKRADYLVYTVK